MSVTYRRLRNRPFWRSAPAMLAVTVLVAAGVVAGALTLVPSDAPDEPTAERYRQLDTRRAVRADVRGEPAPVSVLANAVAAPTVPPPPVYAAPIDRVRVPKIGVDAPITIRGIDSTGRMENPRGPDDIAWYQFTTKPGLGGNAVFSGHVDYVGRGPAVLWDLKKLAQGDVVEVALSDGTLLEYAIDSTQSFDVDDIPMEDVLAPTALDTLTIITCTGSFVAGDYTHRLVVKATRTKVTEPG
ncbi:MAG: class F sortase [Dehalococcoidia bacterium]